MQEKLNMNWPMTILSLKPDIKALLVSGRTGVEVGWLQPWY
jgi:hypothetical protein